MTLDPKQDVKSQIEYMLSNCELNLRFLDDWEQNFIASIRQKLLHGYELTDRQIEKLEECHGKTP